MHIRRFYKIAIWLPLSIPVVTALGSAIFGTPTPMALRTITFAIIVSGFFGAIPYSLFALWAGRWVRGKSDAQIRQFALRAPAFMLILFLPLALLIGAANGDAVGGAFFLLVTVVPCVLVLGYSYVGFVCWIRHVAQTRHWIATLPGVGA